MLLLRDAVDDDPLVVGELVDLLDRGRAHPAVVVLEHDDLAVVSRVVEVKSLAEHVFLDQHPSGRCQRVEDPPRFLRLRIVATELSNELDKGPINIFEHHDLFGVFLVPSDQLLNDELLIAFAVAVIILEYLDDLLLRLVAHSLILGIWMQQDDLALLCHEIVLLLLFVRRTDFDFHKINILTVSLLMERQTLNLFSLSNERMRYDVSILIFQLIFVQSIWRVDDVEVVLLLVHGDEVDLFVLAHVIAQAVLSALDDLLLRPNLFFFLFATHEELRHWRR